MTFLQEWNLRDTASFASLLATRKYQTKLYLSSAALWSSWVHIVAEPKWDLADCCHQKKNSRGLGWWERKEIFVKMLHNLGMQRTARLQTHQAHLHKAQAKPSCSQDDQNPANPTQCLEFQLFPYLSFGA